MEVHHSAARKGDARLIIVSNRLPVVVQRDARGAWSTRPGSGGLVTALTPVLRERGGLWIGNPGTSSEDNAPVRRLLDRAAPRAAYRYEPVLLGRQQLQDYYYGFSNQIIWPLFHDQPSRCRYEPAYWEAYRAVNEKFAHAVAGQLHAGDFVWVQDYHLMGAAAPLRRYAGDTPIGFFLHIPFPAPDLFALLPWRFEVLHGLLQYDLLGFQTNRDLRHFEACVTDLAEGMTVVKTGRRTVIRGLGREVRAGAFPISIDFEEFESLAASDEIERAAANLRERFDGVTMVMSADRLDYTKGLLAKLRAFRSALDRHPELRKKVSLVQIVVPSRTQIPEYNQLRRRVEQFVGEINGLYTQAGWVPVHYVYRNLDRRELVSYYRAADVALLTPVKDGMNLVAKEYCASSTDERGVLILSEFAGAAAHMQDDALLVHPHDCCEIADALHRAFTMPAGERRRRMRNLRRTIREHDIYWWVDGFLRAADSSCPEAFPRVHDYVRRPRASRTALPASGGTTPRRQSAEESLSRSGPTAAVPDAPALVDERRTPP